MRLKLTIAYDGRPFDGWATQPSGNTVQDLLENAICQVSKIEAGRVRVHASGRTDAGVHAMGQILHFDVPDGMNMNPYNWVPALNTKLPATIRVMDGEQVANDFHARFSAKAKTYHYDLCLAPVLPPLLAGLAWHLPRQLDPETLEQAIAMFQGEHDFQAFSAKRGNETDETSHRRTVSTAAITRTELGYQLQFTGDGFLYKMVRILTGTAVQAAQGRMRLDEITTLLDQPEGLPHGRSRHCAPADGLALTQVDYGE